MEVFDENKFQKLKTDQNITTIQLGLGAMECNSSGLSTDLSNQTLPSTEISCLQCRFQTDRPDLMEKHVKEEHEKIKNLACKLCNYVTWANYNLERHVKRCHDKRIKDKDLTVKDLKCSQCNYKTALPDRLAKHSKEVHEMAKDILCNLCNYQTKRKSNLEAHMQRIHEKKKQLKDKKIEQEIITTVPLSAMPMTTTEIITVPVVQHEVQIQTTKWAQPTIVYQQHSYYITE